MDLKVQSNLELLTTGLGSTECTGSKASVKFIRMCKGHGRYFDPVAPWPGTDNYQSVDMKVGLTAALDKRGFVCVWKKKVIRKTKMAKIISQCLDIHL